MKVVIKDNNPNSYQIGIIVGFHPLSPGENCKRFTTKVLCKKDGKVYTILGITVPYTKKLVNVLNKLMAMEQYIYLTKGNPWSHPDIRIKNGKYYGRKEHGYQGCRTYKRICKELHLPYEHIDFGYGLTN